MNTRMTIKQKLVIIFTLISCITCTVIINNILERPGSLRLSSVNIFPAITGIFNDE